jgi:hypothetical protein
VPLPCVWWQDVDTTAFRWMYFIAAILPFWLIIDVL